MLFSIKVQKWLHSGPTDPYWAEVKRVEAPTAREAGEAFAAGTGLKPLWWFEGRFDLGTERYSVSCSKSTLRPA